MILRKNTFFVGSVWNKKDREAAAKLLSAGEIIGIFNRGVCALWFDGGNRKSVKKVSTIKGEGRQSRPIALTLSLEEFIPMLDLDELPNSVKKLFRSSDLKNKIGSLCFIRAPIKKSFQKKIPDEAKSFNEEGICMLQNWDSFGHAPVEKFLNYVRKLGVKHPAVTSMNISGQPEIVNQKEGEIFCKNYSIPIFLKDERSHPDHLGSYTIFTFQKNGIKLERDGNIPGFLFKYIFGLPIYTKDAKSIKHPQLKFPENKMKNLSPSQIRQAILLFIKSYV